MDLIRPRLDGPTPGAAKGRQVETLGHARESIGPVRLREKLPLSDHAAYNVPHRAWEGVKHT